MNMTGRPVLAAAALLLCFGSAGPAVSQDAGRDLVRFSGLRGGMCVVLGCADGRLAAALTRAGDFLVHEVCVRREEEAQARRELQAQGLYGAASAEHLNLSSLPYPDYLVNLIVAPDFPRLLESGLALTELWRVLCPGGVALLGSVSEEAVKSRLGTVKPDEFALERGPGAWLKLSRRRPACMDDWTEARHGAGGNRVSQDSAEIPAGPQWIAGPVWGPHVWSPDHLVVGGRYVHVPPGGRELVARDAFNGLPLWRRAQAEGSSACRLWAATSAHLFASFDGKLQALDLSTGNTVTSYGEAGVTDEVLFHRDVLIVVQQQAVRAVEASSGRFRWKRATASADPIAGDGRLFYLDTSKTSLDLVGVDLDSGKEVWRKATAAWRPGAPVRSLYAHEPPVTLRLFQDGKLFLLSESDKKWALRAVAARDGRDLWSYAYSNPPYFRKDVLFQRGSIWVTRGAERTANPWHGVVWEALDPADGSVKRTLETPGLHAGCQQSIATGKYLLIPKSMRFVDVDTGKSWTLGSAYGACGRGVIAGSGLLYAPPFACGCQRAALRGYVALTPPARRSAGGAADEAARLETGPADILKGSAPREGDWPTYRGDARRSGTTAQEIPLDLAPMWEARAEPAPDPRVVAREGWDVPGNRWITSPVCAEDLAVVAYPEFHRICAYDAVTGKPRWSFTAGARVTSPPTLTVARCVFGSQDGWVYCLRSRDGTLLWRYRAAPEDRRLMAFGQLESHWPVPGSVLVEGGRVYGAAGRSNLGLSEAKEAAPVEGDLRIFALELASGKRVWEKRLPAVGNARFQALNDILVSDGSFAYLRDWRLDLRTGEHGPTWWLKPFPDYVMGGTLGLLDDSWCRYAESHHSAQQRWKDRRGSEEGQFLIMDRRRTFGFRTREWAQDPAPELFAQDYAEGGKGKRLWRLPVPEPFQVEALLLAGETLWAAGPSDRKQRREGVLWAISAADGKKHRELKLPAPPVFQGMAAAMGRLYVSTADGKLLCLGKP